MTQAQTVWLGQMTVEVTPRSKIQFYSFYESVQDNQLSVCVIKYRNNLSCLGCLLLPTLALAKLLKTT